MSDAHVWSRYTPRAWMDPYHARTQRWALLVAHRRAGKTTGCCYDLVERAALNERAWPPPRYAWLAPLRIQAKETVWSTLKHYALALPGSAVNESELYVELPNRSRISLYGADAVRTMGQYLDGIVIDEADDVPPKVFGEVIRPALADYGGWATWTGVFRGRSTLWRMREDHQGDPTWYVRVLRASESAILPPAELAAMERDMGRSAYAAQMEADVSAAQEASVYGSQMEQARAEGRIGQLKADSVAPLLTSWDIGYSDHTCVWLLQPVGRDLLALDYTAASGAPAGELAARMVAWEREYDRPITAHYLPHDADRHEAGTGKTYADHLREAGIRSIKIVPRTPDEWLGIASVRRLFPSLRISAEKCGRRWRVGPLEMPSGIDCLDYFSRQQDTSRGYLRDVTIHDQHSHGASALRTYAEAWERGMVEGTSFVTRAIPPTVEADRKMRLSKSGGKVTFAESWRR